MSNLGTSLWITLVGMGLVFLGLLVMWGLMELIVRLFKDRSSPKEEIEAVEAPVETIAATAGDLVALKARVAAAAVAVALSDQKQRAANSAVAMALSGQTPASSGPDGFQPPVPGISAWQAVLRAGQMNTRGHSSK